MSNKIIWLLLIVFSMFVDSVGRRPNIEYICPDCGETGCIYEDIDTLYDESYCTIDEAITAVCKERGIVESVTIQLIKANYSPTNN